MKSLVKLVDDEERSRVQDYLDHTAHIILLSLYLRKRCLSNCSTGCFLFHSSFPLPRTFEHVDLLSHIWQRCTNLGRLNLCNSGKKKKIAVIQEKESKAKQRHCTAGQPADGCISLSARKHNSDFEMVCEFLAKRVIAHKKAGRDLGYCCR